MIESSADAAGTVTRPKSMSSARSSADQSNGKYAYRRSSTRSATSEKIEKFVPLPSQVAPSG